MRRLQHNIKKTARVPPPLKKPAPLKKLAKVVKVNMKALRQKPASAKNAQRKKQALKSWPDDFNNAIKTVKERSDVVVALSQLKTKRQPFDPRPFNCRDKNTPARVGGAYSGWASEMFALENLGVHCKHVFICERDEEVRKLCLALHTPNQSHPDFTKPEPLISEPLDFFMGSPSCKSFSIAGYGEGVDSQTGDGLGFIYIAIWIEAHLPRCFLLENVKGLLTHHKDFLLWFLKTLCAIKEPDTTTPAYDISWKVLNTKTHGGLPQNRERVFIAGVRKSCQQCAMVWPQPMPMRTLTSFFRKKLPPNELAQVTPPSGTVARRNLQVSYDRARRQGIEPLKKPVIVDLWSTNPNWSATRSPCLTAGRAKGGGHWISTLGRTMTSEEMMRLQGVDPRRVMRHAKTVSKATLNQVIGNAISVPILERVLEALFFSAGMLSQVGTKTRSDD